jgi:hypothetical protein
VAVKAPNRKHWRVVTSPSYHHDQLSFIPQYRRLWWHGLTTRDRPWGYIAFASDDECREFVAQFEPLSFTPSEEQPRAGCRLPEPKQSKGCSPVPWIVGAALLLG